MNQSDKHAPYTLYKLDISYFSGKLEAYLRYKDIDHQAIDVDRSTLERIFISTGTKKIPAVETARGQWLFDTTPMIQWFEGQYPENSVMPSDPALRFIALVLEDYADEWLWRPAMWWRWMPRVSRWALGWRIAAPFMPRGLVRLSGWYFARRQLKEWLWDDGVTANNSDQVRDMLYREFEFLEGILAKQPYLLGSHPSIADFGYFASMFRHFGNDVESAEVMRRQAPNTYEWLARLWNAKSLNFTDGADWVWPNDDAWGPLFSRVCKDYLPYLHQNAVAHKNEQPRFDYRGENFVFRNTQTTTYRVWCRESLQSAFGELTAEHKQRAEALFDPFGGLASLHTDGVIASGLADSFKLPVDPAKVIPKKQTLKTKIFGQARN